MSVVLCASFREVNGIPNPAAAPNPAVIPAIVSNVIPALANASASSAPLPNMKGSPPFKRTTILPLLASSINRL